MEQGTPQEDDFLSDLCMFWKNREKMINSLPDLLEFSVGWSRVCNSWPIKDGDGLEIPGPYLGWGDRVHRLRFFTTHCRYT